MDNEKESHPAPARDSHKTSNLELHLIQNPVPVLLSLKERKKERKDSPIS